MNKITDLFYKTTFSLADFCRLYMGTTRQNLHARLSQDRSPVDVIELMADGLAKRAAMIGDLEKLLRVIVKHCDKEGLNYYEQGSIKSLRFDQALEKFEKSSKL